MVTRRQTVNDDIPIAAILPIGLLKLLSSCRRCQRSSVIKGRLATKKTPYVNTYDSVDIVRSSPKTTIRGIGHPDEGSSCTQCLTTHNCRLIDIFLSRKPIKSIRSDKRSSCQLRLQYGRRDLAISNTMAIRNSHRVCTRFILRQYAIICSVTKRFT